MSNITFAHRQALKQLGFPPLKWIQEQVIASILAGDDTLALLPTGTGKSLCFQVPAVLLQKPTLVISPLLALMQDQVDQLTNRGMRSAHWSSLTSPDEQRQIIQDLEQKKLQLLYLSPEKIANPRVFEVLERVAWGVLAVDEAHCVVSWGESFRPHYCSLGPLLQKLQKTCGAVRFACTATATPRTLEKMQSSLLLQNPALIATPNLRPNLRLGIIQPPSPAATKETIFRVLQQWWEHETGTALIYVSTRLATERLASWLQNCGLPAQAFHAGLSKSRKLELLNHFCSAKRSLFVATCALGMGVDQPEVRLVIHAESPTDLESYVQEVGRAGRDGQPARALWLYQRAQFLESVEDRKKKNPERWFDLKQSAQHVMNLAEKQKCITKTLQDIFASQVVPESCLWECNCNRCDLRPWLVGPNR